MSVVDDYQEEEIMIHHDHDNDEEEDAVVLSEAIPVPPIHEVFVRPVTSLANFVFTSTSLASDGGFNDQIVN